MLFVPAFLSVLLVYLVRGSAKAVSLFVFCAGLMTGFLLSSGYWMYVLQTHYGNPIFPFFNAVFQSDYIAHSNFRDTRWMVHGLKHFLFFPYYEFRRWLPSGELGFKDCRYLVSFGVIGLITFQKATELISTLSSPVGKQRGFVHVPNLPWSIPLLFFVVAYYTWVLQFCYWRYLAPLELLTPTLILWMLCASLKTISKVLPLAMACLVLILSVTRIPNWGRRSWSDRYLDVQTPEVSRRGNILVVMTGMPSAYLIPFFPSNCSFIRIGVMETERTIKETELAIQEHSGTFYLLSTYPTLKESMSYLEKYGLVPNEATGTVPSMVINRHPLATWWELKKR